MGKRVELMAMRGLLMMFLFAALAQSMDVAGDSVVQLDMGDEVQLGAADDESGNGMLGAADDESGNGMLGAADDELDDGMQTDDVSDDESGNGMLGAAEDESGNGMLG